MILRRCCRCICLFILLVLGRCCRCIAHFHFQILFPVFFTQTHTQIRSLYTCIFSLSINTYILHTHILYIQARVHLHISYIQLHTDECTHTFSQTHTKLCVSYIQTQTMRRFLTISRFNSLGSNIVFNISYDMRLVLSERTVIVWKELYVQFICFCQSLLKYKRILKTYHLLTLHDR